MKRRGMITVLMCSALLCGGALQAEKKSGVKGNPNSKKYHRPACVHYDAKGSSVSFTSAAEAEKAGYKPCRQCGGKDSGK